MSGSVLDVEGGSASIFAPIICYKQHGDENQLWRIHKYQGYADVYYIENVQTGLVL